MGSGSKVIKGSRSFSHLVKSPGDAPAVEYIIDSRLKGLFEYFYGGWNLSKVVLPKGTLVGVNRQEKDFRTLQYRPALTFAGTDSVAALGLAPMSYFRRFNDDGTVAHDLPEGDDYQPGIITRELVEVPYLPNPEYVYADPTNVASATMADALTALKFWWGCATNVKTLFDAGNTLKEGDFVKAGPFGKFVKWVAGTDSPHLIVGQVLGMELNVPPDGFLKYIEPEVYTNALRSNGDLRDEEQPQPYTADGPYYDPDFKWPLTSDYRSPQAWKTIGSGIEGLTDGEQMAYRKSKGSLAATETEITIQADQLVTILRVTKVTVAGEEVALEGVGAVTVSINKTTNAITVSGITADAGNAQEVVVEYKIDAVGVPPAWDFAGSVGVAQILLKF
jgi:hypothetical protein